MYGSSTGIRGRKRRHTRGDSHRRGQGCSRSSAPRPPAAPPHRPGFPSLPCSCRPPVRVLRNRLPIAEEHDRQQNQNRRKNRQQVIETQQPQRDQKITAPAPVRTPRSSVHPARKSGCRPKFLSVPHALRSLRAACQTTCPEPESPCRGISYACQAQLQLKSMEAATALHTVENANSFAVNPGPRPLVAQLTYTSAVSPPSPSPRRP